MKVLSVGAGGRTAGLVVRALSQRGVSVQGLVHTAEAEGRARADGAEEVVIADLNDEDALVEALDGLDGVFHVIPAFVPDEAATGVVMARAAQRAGVRRLVFSSVHHPSLDDLSNHRDEQAVEQALHDSDLEFVVLQPAMSMSQLDGSVQQAQRSGVISGGWSAAAKMTYVDYRDLAEVAADSFLTDRTLHGTFELSAPGMFSREDVAAVLSRLLGRAVRTGTEPPRLPDSMPPASRDGISRTTAHDDRFGFHGGNASVLRALLGREPTSVEAYPAAAVG